MGLKRSVSIRTRLLISVMVSLTVLSMRSLADTGMCGGATVTLSADGLALTTLGGTPTRIKSDGSNGGIIQSVIVGNLPRFPVFDGTNIWVPNQSANTVTVVRASTGSVLTTLTGNGLNGPLAAAFDGEGILITNTVGDSVSLWKAADLTPIGSISMGVGTQPFGVCSDGLNFWITLFNTGKVARF